MKFLTFDCRKYFQTPGSVCYDLIEPADMSQLLPELSRLKAVSCVGTLEVHFPIDTHIKVYLRAILPAYVAKKVERAALESAVEALLQSLGLPSGVTYEADLIPCDLITRVENRIDVEGKTDCLGA